MSSLEIPASLQTTPLNLGWTINSSIPAGNYLRVVANGLQCIGLYRGESLSVQARTGGAERELPITHRYDLEHQKLNWMYCVTQPVRGRREAR